MNAIVAAALLVVLTETGQTREGLPVYRIHPQNAAIAAKLDRGVSAELLRVYRFLHVRRQRESGAAVEPAYLLLSSKQGGFARYGFWLGSEKKAGVAYVDVHKDWELTGGFGAIDQIFPHELSHAILHQLGSEPPKATRANQVHAIGVRTDRFTAFNEGLAEHFQIMAVDHPSAAGDTRALAKARDQEAAALRHLDEFARELDAHFSPASRMRIGFPLWYSQDERVLRYFAVKENLFARERPVPQRLLEERDRYDAYLFENVMPGRRDDAMKPLARLIASEGAVSALFHRWATSEEIRRTRRDEAFYALYGTTSRELTPLQNLYLKLYHAIAANRAADVPSMVQSYTSLFPDEAPFVDAVVAEVFGVARVASPPELWVANDDLQTGTTLFDQFRGIPRVHTFDVNAASVVDLTTVPALKPDLARAIAAGAPYASLGELRRVRGLGPDVVARFETMRSAITKLDAQGEETLSFEPMLIAYAKRAGIVLIAAAIVAAIVFRMRRRLLEMKPSIVRCIFSGLAAALVAIAANWVTGEPLVAIAVVMVLFGVPSALWLLLRTRNMRMAFVSLAIWAAMAIPGVVLTSAF